jgi:2-keto-4-pentenoate hydratase/2-oxohepta-3-ene-1,7-dioic acid hydratase in catechol pathway
MVFREGDVRRRRPRRPDPPAADRPGAGDFEGEVAIVIGRRATSIAAADAWGHVAGITACNDVSARDVQFATGNFGWPSPSTRSARSAAAWPPSRSTTTPTTSASRRGWTGATPARPHVEPDLPVPTLLSTSPHTTLEPGDVVSTGSPAGAGIADGRYLRDGSVVDVRVQHVLPLVNPVVEG